MDIPPISERQESRNPEGGCYRLRVNVELEVKDTESQSQTEAVIRSYIKFLQGLEQEASAYGTDFVLNLKIK